MVSKRVGGRRRGGCTRGRIDECNSIVCFGCIMNISVVWSEGLRVVLLLLALGLFLLVQLALVFLVFRYAGLQGIG